MKYLTLYNGPLKPLLPTSALDVHFRPSKLSLPQLIPGMATVLEYLLQKFPTIVEATWRERMSEGKAHRDEDMQVIAMGQVVI